MYVAWLVVNLESFCYKNVQVCLLRVVLEWAFVKDINGGGDGYINRANPLQILCCLLVLKQQGNEATSLCW